jgi:hypothetical protein
MNNLEPSENGLEKLKQLYEKGLISEQVYSLFQLKLLESIFGFSSAVTKIKQLPRKNLPSLSLQ